MGVRMMDGRADGCMDVEQSHAYQAQLHVEERNRLVEAGGTLKMPSPPPVFEDDDEDDGAAEAQDHAVAATNGDGDGTWASTTMAPPLNLRVDDIRVKVRTSLPCLPVQVPLTLHHNVPLSASPFDSFLKCEGTGASHASVMGSISST